MPNVLILCAHRPKRSPSQRYRFEQYIPFLEKKGFHFTWSPLLNETNDRIFYSNGNTLKKIPILFTTLITRFKDAKRFKNFDIIFIQREALFLGTSYFEKKAFESGAKVIFDFDDSIWLEDTSPANKKWAWIKKPSKFFNTISYASIIIAGNSYLADKAKTVNKNTVIIPTTIDTDIHAPKPQLRNKEVINIGWSGSISTIKHFQSLLPVLKRVKEKYKHKIHFKIIGDSNYKNSELTIEAISWSENTEVAQLNTFDIGIMPLINDEWTKGKCGLKGLSYMACEVATVMSNVGVNATIIENNVNGLLANNDQEWFDALCKLIENKELRERLGKNGRITVIEKYSVEANKEKYLEIFSTATKVKRAVEF
ncbi:MAG: glycosyltransferase family 4 protein [Bacteroidetes bacterium]|nr:glycosyltransferase family 4 protein [Bacteroidota bacterium]